jgi:hypothetical protein
MAPDRGGRAGARYSPRMTTPFHSIPGPRRAGRSLSAVLAAGALALAGAPAARAETSGGTALKNTAIVGTVATWAFSALKGAPFGSCLVYGDPRNDGWGARVAAGKDAELKYEQLGLERHECKMADAGPFSLDMSPVIAAGAWQADSGSLYAKRAWDVSLVPMFHWRAPIAQGTRLDLEFGIGPAYLSRSSIGDRVKSTGFQFSDHFGIGVSSADGHWRAGFAFRHLSNLSIKTPNTAVDFKGIALEWTP